MFTTQFHVKEQGAAKPIHRRRRRQDESVLKKVLDIDRRFIEASSALSCHLTQGALRYVENAEKLDHSGLVSPVRCPYISDGRRRVGARGRGVSRDVLL